MPAPLAPPAVGALPPELVTTSEPPPEAAGELDTEPPLAATVFFAVDPPLALEAPVESFVLEAPPVSADEFASSEPQASNQPRAKHEAPMADWRRKELDMVSSFRVDYRQGTNQQSRQCSSSRVRARFDLGESLMLDTRQPAD